MEAAHMRAPIFIVCNVYLEAVLTAHQVMLQQLLMDVPDVTQLLNVSNAQHRIYKLATYVLLGIMLKEESVINVLFHIVKLAMLMVA